MITVLGSAALLSATFAGGAMTAASAETGKATDDAAEARSMLASGQSMAEAIAAAEESTGGKAIDASWESRDGSAGMFEVELVNADGTMTTARVNADGSVQIFAQSDDEARGDPGDDDGEDNERGNDNDEDNG